MVFRIFNQYERRQERGKKKKQRRLGKIEDGKFKHMYESMIHLIQVD